MYGTTFKFFIDIGDLFAQVYAATDFFIYILVSRRYRQIFTSMVYSIAQVVVHKTATI